MDSKVEWANKLQKKQIYEGNFAKDQANGLGTLTEKCFIFRADKNNQLDGQIFVSLPDGTKLIREYQEGKILSEVISNET